MMQQLSNCQLISIHFVVFRNRVAHVLQRSSARSDQWNILPPRETKARCQTHKNMSVGGSCLSPSRDKHNKTESYLSLSEGCFHLHKIIFIIYEIQTICSQAANARCSYQRFLLRNFNFMFC